MSLCCNAHQIDVIVAVCASLAGDLRETTHNGTVSAIVSSALRAEYGVISKWIQI